MTSPTPTAAPYIGPAFANPAGYTQPKSATGKPTYEHRDHEGLPVGTRIYFVNGFRMIVRPGQRGPLGRTPDIVILP